MEWSVERNSHTRVLCRTYAGRLSGCRNFRQDRKRNPRTKNPTHDVSRGDYYVRSARRAARSQVAFAFAFAFARSRSAYTRWMLTCDIHVHGTHFLCTVLVQLARRGVQDWPRCYDGTFIREVAHKCQENQPNSGPRIKKGGEISRDPRETTTTSPGISIDRLP